MSTDKAIRGQIEVLRCARDVLATKGWTQGCYARDAQHNPTYYAEPDACSFCAAGALHFAAKDGDVFIAAEALNDVAKAKGVRSFISFNDAQTSVEPVLTLFDEAIAKLEAAQ